jgi:hypothetical protein
VNALALNNYGAAPFVNPFAGLDLSAPGSYLDRYKPDPSGAGFFGAYLANPASFSVPFLDGGATWIVLSDVDGNPWYLLFKTATGQSYDWSPATVNTQTGNVHNSAEAPMVKAFCDIEQQNMDALGFPLDRSWALSYGYETWAPLGRTGHSAWQTIDAGRPYVVHFDRDVNTAPALTWHQAGSDGGTVFSAAVAAGNADARRACRVPCEFRIPPKDSSQPELHFFALGNPQLRIAFVDYVLPDVVYQRANPDLGWIMPLITTFLALITIVVCAITGNVLGIVAAIAGIVATWWNYAEQEAQKASAAAHAGDGLGSRAVGAPKLGSNLPTVRAVTGNPVATRTPTAGELAALQQAKQRTNLILVAIVVAIVVSL